MERKIQRQKEKQPENTTTTNDVDHDHRDNRSKSLVWDCGSSLYDSFELKSFERRLDSAIIASSSSSRTLSMPRLPPRQVNPVSKKPSSKFFSRSFPKLLKSVFGTPKQNNVLNPKAGGGSHEDGFYVVVGNRSSATSLSTIPEAAAAPEYGGGGVLLPDFDGESSLVKRSSSERFTATSVGISCA